MIVIGAYPDCIGTLRPGMSKLASVGELVRSVSPTTSSLHLLPFYPSSGDGGFAPDDWFAVKPDLGDWQDIETLAAERRLVVDGVYNHVGLNHRFFKEFRDSPTSEGYFYAYPETFGVQGPSSPRGMSVIHRHHFGNAEWDLWQTFSAASVDIRLDQPQVRNEIERHLRFLAERGIWAVRLDGCAYYGKTPGQEQFHHPAAKLYARSIAESAAQMGLRVVAQLDCDPEGASYFPTAQGYDVPAVDYALSALLVEALIGGRTRALVKHLRRTWLLPCSVIRPPRTHDGILLQSDLLPDDSFDNLVAMAKGLDLPMRVSNGDYYELNSSFPFICSIGVDSARMLTRIRMVVALTAFLPGWSYFYLPMLLGDIPEGRFAGDLDPRSLNRLHLDPDLLKSEESERGIASMRSLLDLLSQFTDESVSGHGIAEESVEALGDGALSIRWPGPGLRLLCNFSTNETVDLSSMKLGPPVYSELITSHVIEPLGFGIWRA